MPALSPEFWEGERQRLLAVIRPAVESVVTNGVRAATGKLRQAGLVYDTSLVNANAVAWARQYTDDLLERLGTTSQRVVGEVIASWIETPGATMGDLVERLKPHLGGNEARADLVGVTEVTRAFASGEDLVYQSVGVGRALFLPPGHPGCRCWTNLRRLRSANQLVAVWQTNKDDAVCRRPIETPWGMVQGCRAMQGVILSQGEFAGRKFGDVQ